MPVSYLRELKKAVGMSKLAALIVVQALKFLLLNFEIQTKA